MVNSSSLFNFNPVWRRVILFATLTFFIFLSDAILSFWAPNLMSEKLGSPQLMGIIFSFSSAIGFLADLILPQIIRNTSFTKMLVFACLLGILFAILLMIGLNWPLIIIFLLSMAIWGIYYEFLSFADQEFVTGHIPFHLHASAWGILGPLLAPIIILKSEQNLGISAIFMSMIAFIGIFIFYKNKPTKLVLTVEKINIASEIYKWRALFHTIWPVIILSFMVGVIDSFFWTSGAVLTEKLAIGNFFVGWFLSLYMLPPLFIGLIFIKWNPYQGKKKLAECLFFVSGIFMLLLGFQQNITSILIFVFFASLFISIGYPLIQAVVSDFLGRMGKSKRHLLGFSSSAVSLGYILGPIIAGFISTSVGEKLSFTYLGIFVTIVSLVLIFVTPKKIRLSQQEIKSW